MYLKNCTFVQKQAKLVQYRFKYDLLLNDVYYLCRIDVILLHIICSFKAKSLLVINVGSPEREIGTVFFIGGTPSLMFLSCYEKHSAHLRRLQVFQ